ncbi:glutamate synthase-related protein [Micromonospora mangrovi]|uniref:Glutamate synthase-related protein n=2 Tax=Micromonospora TaxID=1873 RepID=A0AAU7MDT7_9ACTN
MSTSGTPAALRADTFPEEAVRHRARTGTQAVFPPPASYGHTLLGAGDGTPADGLDALRLVPPVFMPLRLEKLIDLASEPTYRDVELHTSVGGFAAPLPVYVSAFGSTQVAGADLGRAVARQAGTLGLPMVIGENVVPVNGYGRLGPAGESALLGRLREYCATVPDGLGGVVVQQSTEDADAEVWNLVYSDPSAQPLLDSGRLGFELKVGQGAKPGLGGMTLVSERTAGRLGDQYLIDPVFGADCASVLRSSAPGTFTQEILAHQIHLMRNNYPRARVWVKLPPGRDIAEATEVAWAAGADAVTVDGAEGGTGWAPSVFLDHVGLPLVECLRRIGRTPATGPLLVSGRMWEGARATKALALGANAIGLGRAAILAADTDPEAGLIRLVECLALELRLLISALGRYAVAGLAEQDIWHPEWSQREVELA